MQSSLEDLNKRVEQPMDMNRFRPNIVIDGSVPAWDEDNWQSLQLGGSPNRAVTFHSLKPCSRCKVDTRLCALPHVRMGCAGETAEGEPCRQRKAGWLPPATVQSVLLEPWSGSIVRAIGKCILFLSMLLTRPAMHILATLQE